MRLSTSSERSAGLEHREVSVDDGVASCAGGSTLSFSQGTQVPLVRLRRRVVFERLVARLERAEPGRWVVKGGMATEVRLRDDARLTKDIDLGLRDAVTDPEELHERVVEALGTDLDADGFLFAAAAPEQLATDSGGTPTWRIKVGVQLAGKQLDTVQLDVSPRQHELAAADRIELPNLLAFAGAPAPLLRLSMFIDMRRRSSTRWCVTTVIARTAECAISSIWW